MANMEVSPSITTSPIRGRSIAAGSRYSWDYHPLPLSEQIELLERRCGLVFGREERWVAQDLEERPLPPGAESRFFIPHWNLFGESEEAALWKVLELIPTRHKLNDLLKGKTGPEYLRTTDSTAHLKDRLANDSYAALEGVFISAQFGNRHRNRTAREAAHALESGEFGIDIYTAAIMFLTHPTRLQHFSDMYIACLGSRYGADNTDSQQILVFRVAHGMLQLEPQQIDSPLTCGAVTAFAE